MTTFRITAATPLAVTPDLVARTASGGPVAGKTNATAGGGFNLLTSGGGLRVDPWRVRPWMTVRSVDGERMYVDRLDGFLSRADGWLEGARLRLCRIVNNEWVETESTVAVSAARATSPIPGMDDDDYLPSGTTSITTGMEGFYKPLTTVYFAVAAVGSDGRRSPWSNVVSSATSADIPDLVPGQTVEASPIAPDTNGGRTENAALAAPTGLTVTTDDGGDSFDLSWTASTGAQGYIVHRSAYASFDYASYIEADDTISPQAGDLLIFDLKMDETVTKADFLHHRIWSAGSEAHGFHLGRSWPDGVPSGVSWSYDVENGIPFVRVANASGVTFMFERAVHGPVDGGFYSVLEPGVDYVNKLVARAPTGSATITSTAFQSTVANGTVNLTSDWGTHTPTFSVSQYVTQGAGTVRFEIPAGATVDIREWWTGDGRYDLPGLQPSLRTVMEPAYMLRSHSTVKTYNRTYSGLGLISDPTRLPLFLKVAKEAGHDAVWPQVDPHLWPEDLELLAEYLCTPYDPATDTPASKPGAYIRYQQGQTAPWIGDDGVFTRAFFEMGNELWQGPTVSGFYSMPEVSGEARGVSAGRLGNTWKTKLLENPDFAAADVTWVLGGWVNDANGFTTDYVAGSDDQMPTIVTTADYNGGWENGPFLPQTANDSDWRLVLNNSSLLDRQARSETLVALAASRGWVAGTYEAGPGYQQDGLNGATVTEAQAQSQEEVMKTPAGATATLGAWLTNAAAGVVEQNLFALDEGKRWSSVARPADGGAPAPHWFWIVKFWNEHIAGGQVREMTVGTVSIAPEPSLQGAPQIKGWTIRRGGTTYVALLNLSIDGAKDALVAGLTPGHNVVRHWMTGDDHRAYNQTLATKDSVGLLATALDAIGADGRLRRSIPAGMAEIYEVR